MRAIGYRDLPNSSLKSIGAIPLCNLFPIETWLWSDQRTYIHYDGSVLRFFRLKSSEISRISKIIKSLPGKSSMQIYKHHTQKKDTFYVSLRKEVDYSGVLLGFSLNPVKKIISGIRKLTGEAYESLEKAIDNEVLEETDYLASGLPEVLLDCRVHDLDLRMSSEVRTNLSIIKTGETRFATIASLNNMTVLPKARACFSDFEYLQRIVVVSPSEIRRRKMQLMVLDNIRMIKEIAGETGNSRKVHVDTITGDAGRMLGLAGRIFYADVAFMLSSDSHESLNNVLQDFFRRMEERNIALYCHTNTARSAYISMFPGNEPYAERYSILYEYFLNMLIMNTLEL